MPKFVTALYSACDFVRLFVRLLVCSHRHVLKPGTKQPERPEQESEMTGTTETKIEHDRNNVVYHDRNDSYLGITIVPVVFYYIVPIVFDFGFGGSGHF